MKKWMLGAVMMAPMVCASCAGSLDQIVEAQHQQRISEHYAGRPLVYGQGDGLGSYIADSADSRLTLSDRPAAH
ncbi:MAG TPA: hypothetical protein VHQ47_17320 [Phycisphaerae bacterium]|jgi:hypothetical protein|nr:hypothetical protein [Phycisphaerae bacterium]